MLTISIRSAICLFALILSGCKLNAQQAVQVQVESDTLIMQKPVTRACHASSIESLPGNRLIAAWFGGQYEGHREVAIYTSIFSEGRWQDPVKVAEGIAGDTLRYPCWNPVLFKTASGKLFLFYKVGPNPREWWGEMKFSVDDGRSWSKSERLPSGFLGPVRNRPVQFKDGTIFHPSSTESADEKQWHIHGEISDSAASSWRRIEIDNDSFGVIQPAVLTHGSDTLQMLCRSRQNAIVQTWSFDRGRSWSSLTKLDVLNPNSGIDATTLSSGLHVLVYNPAIAGREWMHGRTELRVAVSRDGQHWKDVYTLVKKTAGEFSYPAVLETADKKLHITYTHDRKNIRHVVLRVITEAL